MPRNNQSRPVSVSVPVSTRPPIAHLPTTIQHQPAGFGQLIKEGIGFGAGQAIAHRAVNAVLGSTATATATGTVNQQPSEQKTPCLSERNFFEACIRSQSINDCNNEILAYKQCIDLN